MANKKPITAPIPDEILAYGRNKILGGGEALQYNQASYRYWYNHLLDVCISSFEWEGLPAEIDPRFIEYTLCTGGMGGFFSLKSGLGMWAFCRAAPYGNMNMYYNPNAIALNPPTGHVPWYRHAYYWARGGVLYEPDAVPVWNNNTRTGMLSTIEYYARRLAHIDRTVDVNIAAQQTPVMILTDEMHKRDAQKFATQLMGHSNIIVGDTHFADGTTTTAIPTVAPYVADKLQESQIKMLNVFYSICGIDNSNTEKRERISDKEATSNNEQVMIIRKSRLENRRRFCLGVARLTDGQYTPTVKYAAPYRQDGNVDMSYGGDRP